METAVQATALQALGCHLAQGFYFSRAAPAARIQHLLEQGLWETYASDVARPREMRTPRRRRPRSVSKVGLVPDPAFVHGPAT